MARTDIVLNTKSTGAQKAANDANLVKKSWLTTASELANVWRVAGKAISAVGKLFTAQIDAAGKWVDMVDQVNVATGGNAQAMIDWSDAVAQATGQSQDYIFELGKLSLQFTNNHEKSNEMAQAALVMSKTLGIDAQSALRMLSQSLTGTAGRMKQFIPEVANMTAEQLKAGEVIDAVNKRLGPQYEATLKNWSTQYMKLTNVIGDRYLEALALSVVENEVVVGGLTEFNNILVEVAPNVDNVKDAIGDMALTGIELTRWALSFGDIFGSVFGGVMTTLNQVGVYMIDVLRGNLDAAIQMFEALGADIQKHILPEGFVSALKSGLDTLGEIKEGAVGGEREFNMLADSIEGWTKDVDVYAARIQKAMESAKGAAKDTKQEFKGMSFEMEAMDFGIDSGGSKGSKKTESKGDKQANEIKKVTVAQQELNKSVSDYVGWSGIASGASQELFNMMLNGTDDVGGAFLGMAQNAANAIFSQALSSAISNAIQSATASQAAMSGIPVVGPLLGIAAAGAALSFGLGLVAKLRSEGKPKGAAYGTEIRGGIPGFDSIPIMAKAGEKILNPTEAREYEAMQRGRMNQGNNMINVNVGMITPVSRSQTQRQIRETVALEISRLIRKNKLSFGRA